MTKFANDMVEAMVVGRQFDQQKLRDQVTNQYRATQYRDAFHLEIDQGEIWLFVYGVVVFWGVPEDIKTRLMKQLQPVIETPMERQEREWFTFTFGGESVQMREDLLTLNNDEALERLAVSHALAQSVKLGHFEVMAQGVIQKNAFIPRRLAESGKIPLRSKALAKLRGTLFSVKSDIVLNFNLLDTPEFFWSYPELEPTYKLVARYLDLDPRISVLNKKLETIHELLNMLASEQHHHHSTVLEWIVIVLIAVEVALFFWH